MKTAHIIVGVMAVLSLAIPGMATQVDEGFNCLPLSSAMWEKTSVGSTHPGIDFTNHYMYVGNDGGGTGYRSRAENGYVWSAGVATFWVKDWGAGAIFGVASADGTLSLGFRNDTYDPRYASVFINTTWYQESAWQWPAYWDGTVASVVQVIWDNRAGTVTFRFYNNTGRSVAPGVLPGAWQGQVTYTFTPTNEPLSLYAYAYGGPDTYFEYITAKPPQWVDDGFADWRLSPQIWEKDYPSTTLPLIDCGNAYMIVGADGHGTGYHTNVSNGCAWLSGVATFWVKDWGAGGVFGVKSVGDGLSLGFRNDVNDTHYATAFVNTSWYQDPSWQWPAYWDGTVASVVQVAWDNLVGAVTFRFYDNTGRSVAPGVLPGAWQGEATYTFTPTNEPMYLFTYAYGGPNTYFEHISAKPSVVFSPAGLYLSGPTPVAMSCATPGAVIHYTTDGSEPTAASPVYTGPVTVCNEAQAMTLKAMAIVPGGRTSGFASEQYAISLVADRLAEITRGHHLLIKRGLQIQALVFPRLDIGGAWVGFDRSRFLASNFTSANLWGDTSQVADDIGFCLGAAPGILWGRVADAANELTPIERPYLSNMVDFQYPGDDKVNITSPTILQSMRDWYALNRNRYPDVINHDDQCAGRYSQSQIQSMIIQTQPDLTIFCYYPFDGNVTGDSPTGLYSYLQEYRQIGLAGLTGNGSQPIPYGIYLQTYLVSGHSPTESELYLNQFAAWAFGYKFVSAYTYGTPYPDEPNYSSLFTGLGDANPTASLQQISEINRQSRNLGPALVRLISTDVRMVMGQHWGKNNWWEQNHTIDNDAPGNVTTGLAGVAGSYISNVTATNTGGANDGKRGDVVIGFFKPLHESFDGPGFTNQQYFMIVNGLANQGGPATTGHQQIRVDFNFGSSGITSLQRRRRADGLIERVNLAWDGGSAYHLILELDGGQGDLFKYNTGAPFVGFDSFPGDANGDGKVTFADFSILQNNYGQSNKTWTQGDFNGDHRVTFEDFCILQNYYGQSGTAPAASETVGEEETLPLSGAGCGAAGLALIAGFFGLCFGFAARGA